MRLSSDIKDEHREFIVGAWEAVLFTAGLYSENPNAPAEYGPGNVPDPADVLSERDYAEFVSDCMGFVSDPDVASALECAERDYDMGGMYRRAGADFHFTRNRHGCGFSDGGWGEGEATLGGAARAWGSFELLRGTEEDPDGPAVLWRGKYEVIH